MKTKGVAGHASGLAGMLRALGAAAVGFALASGAGAAERSNQLAHAGQSGSKGEAVDVLPHIFREGFENETLQITSAASATFRVGQSGSFSVTTNEPASLTLAGSVPAGLAFDAGTGALSGTPVATTGGLRQLQVIARVNSIPVRVQLLALTVEEAAVFTSDGSADCVVGTPCTFTLAASGFPAPTYALPGLPEGLSLDAASGVVSGTPATGTGASLSLDAAATNIVGTTTQPFALTISEAPSMTSAGSLACTVGAPCAFQFTASGHPAPGYALPGLPAGLSLDGATGSLGGTPASGTGGLVELTATATNAVGSDPQAFALTINEAPTVTSANSLACDVGATCTFQFTASGYPAPTYSLPGLPAGLSLDSTSGALSGTPEAGTGGEYVLTLGADNGHGTPAAQTFTLTLTARTPEITAVAPDVLVPGESATLTGVRFDPVAGNNTVTIDGVAMNVTVASATTLVVTVPCIPSGTLPLRVQNTAGTSPDFPHPLQASQHALGVGDAVIVTSAGAAACTELTATGEASRYLLAVFSNNASPSSSAPFELSADGQANAGATAAAKRWHAPLMDTVQAPPQPVSKSQLEEQESDLVHQLVLEANEREHERLRARFAGDPRLQPDTSGVQAELVEPPLTRTFRVSNITPPTGQSICSSFYVVAATRVYYNGKVAIYEDDATPAAFKAATSAAMASNYQRIGDQFNADMEPVVRANFGDVLVRDAITDNNGVLVALFTPHLNNNVPGVAGYVVSCDQYPNDDTATPGVGGPYTTTGGSNGASNFGEFFYAYQPAVDATGYSGNTPENWYRTIRSTFIHESKHVASMAARTVNNVPLEAAWLEEGTARHAEELWMRTAVDAQAWKANIPYGSQANPINLWCDYRPTWAECNANPRRPANIMQRHFASLYTNLFGQNARLLSPFGPTPSDNQSYYYAIAWSFVRYAVDRYGLSDADFLSALNQSPNRGIDNLVAVSGASVDELLGGWALSLVADDYPGLSVANPDIQMPTWNFRGIYAGMNNDFPSTYTLPFPQAPTQLPFGNFTAPTITTLRGGGVVWYELSGTQADAQMIRLRGASGAALPANVRIGVARVQ